MAGFGRCDLATECPKVAELRPRRITQSNPLPSDAGVEYRPSAKPIGRHGCLAPSRQWRRNNDFIMDRPPYRARELWLCTTPVYVFRIVVQTAGIAQFVLPEQSTADRHPAARMVE